MSGTANAEKVANLMRMTADAFEARRYSEAKSSVEKLLKLEPLLPEGMLYKGAILFYGGIAELNIPLALGDYQAAVRAGKAHKTKLNKLESQLKKLRKASLDALFVLKWVFKQDMRPVSDEVRRTTESLIATILHEMMDKGLLDDAVHEADSELARMMRVPEHRFRIGMDLWEYGRKKYDTIPFGTEHYIVPALADMSDKEAAKAVERVNRIAVEDDDTFTVWYETFMYIWRVAGRFSDGFEAAAYQLPEIARLQAVRGPNGLGCDAFNLYRSVYEYNMPSTVRRNIRIGRSMFDELRKHPPIMTKEYRKKAELYSRVFEDLDEATAFLDPVPGGDPERGRWYVPHERRGPAPCDGNLYQLMELLEAQEGKMLRSSKEIARLKGDITTMFRNMCGLALDLETPAAPVPERTGRASAKDGPRGDDGRGMTWARDRSRDRSSRDTDCIRTRTP